MANLPLPVAAPINAIMDTYGNPANAFAYVAERCHERQGWVVAAVENFGVNDHWLLSVAYFVGLNANGSWGSPTVMWSGNEQFGLTYEPPLAC